MKTQPAPAPDKLRRIALDRQGLLKQAPFGRGPAAAARAIEQLGYVQIDTISVVERAHHHVLVSRVPNYQPADLDRLLAQRQVFEFWYHAAAYLPMRDYRYSLPHMEAMRKGEFRWIRCSDQQLMRDVLRHVANEGPVRARDFETPGAAGASGWWNWKPAKQALEQLFMQGDLMVVGREGFQKIYDLREKVLPADIDVSMPDVHEQADHLLENALRSHGFATRKSVTYLRQGKPLREALGDRITALIAEQRLLAFRLPSGETAYGDPELLESRAPTAPKRVRILSPFDNAVIQRDRNQAVFDYDYQIECYVPADKRRYGYFCLPLLYGDRFVGRADCKAHRKNGVFEVKALHIEDSSMKPEGEEAQRFLAALDEALAALALFNDCDEVRISAVTPSAWRAARSGF